MVSNNGAWSLLLTKNEWTSCVHRYHFLINAGSLCAANLSFCFHTSFAYAQQAKAKAEAKERRRCIAKAGGSHYQRKCESGEDCRATKAKAKYEEDAAASGERPPAKGETVQLKAR